MRLASEQHDYKTKYLTVLEWKYIFQEYYSDSWYDIDTWYEVFDNLTDYFTI